MHNQAAPPSEPSPAWAWLLGCPKWLFVLCLMGVVWVACATGESLWLDELHTSWTISGSWGEVASRARQGNQSPLFFYGLFALARTLGNLGGIPGEFLLRLPSVLCWGATLFICLRIAAQAGISRAEQCGLDAQRRPWRYGQSIDWRFLVDAPRPAMGVAIVLWLLLDRIQLFYATEARVYAMVQLVSLAAWCCIARLAACESPQAGRRSILLWCGLSMLLLNLHLTAALASVCQIACGTWVIHRRHPRLRWVWMVAVVGVLLALVAAWQLSSQVWEHRQQWASFAGEASWSTLLGLFPLAAYLVPVLAARLVDGLRCLGPLVNPPGHRSPRAGLAGGSLGPRFHRWLAAKCQRERDFPQWLWWIAAAGPWLIAWCITGLGIAPVFHRRFVIVAAIPLVLVAATQLARIRRPRLRWLAVIGVAAWLIVSQGTLDNWRAGTWYGWQRSEGWRQASQFLQLQAKAGDSLWCCSGLIEASGAKLPLSESLNRYLSFPLRGLYRVLDAQGEPLKPLALIGGGASWQGQLLAADAVRDSGLDARQGRAGEYSVEGRPDGQRLAGDQWIVYRGSPASFARHLRQLQQPSEAGQPARWRAGVPRSFGLVSVVRVTRVPRSDGSPSPSGSPPGS